MEGKKKGGLERNGKKKQRRLSNERLPVILHCTEDGKPLD